MASAYFCCLPHCHGVSFPKSALFQVIALLSRPGTQHQMTLGSCVECLSEILRVFGPIPPPSSAASRALSVAGECWQMYFESLLIIISHYPVYALIGDDQCWHSFHLIDLVLGTSRFASEQHSPLGDSHSLFILVYSGKWLNFALRILETYYIIFWPSSFGWFLSFSIIILVGWFSPFCDAFSNPMFSICHNICIILMSF